jgi:hypothetical protein
MNGHCLSALIRQVNQRKRENKRSWYEGTVSRKLDCTGFGSTHVKIM